MMLIQLEAMVLGFVRRHSSALASDGPACAPALHLPQTASIVSASI
jgi:hypothetical protein